MKHDLILIDPPFWYNKRNPSSKFGGGAGYRYPLMQNQELLAFKSEIDRLSADNCIMFMWTTCPRTAFAMKLMEHWGFDVKTKAFSWVKKNRDGSFRQNPGYYGSSNTEDVWLAVKGKNEGRFTPTERMVPQIIYERIRQHSRKPDEAAKRIERMYPELTKIEIFAREQREGWTAWGNEVDKFN